MEEQSSRADAEQLEPEAIESSGDELRADSSDGAGGGEAVSETAAAETSAEPQSSLEEASSAELQLSKSDPSESDDADIEADASESEAEAIEVAAPKPHRPGQPIEVVDESEEQVELAPREWYIIKVQTNREASVRRALIRRIKMMGLEDSFGDIVVPEEKVTEVRGGKKRVVRRKLFPGYVIVHMSLGDDAWHLVRGTSGVGDFTGSGGKPTAMPQHEVDRIIVKEEESEAESPKLQIAFAQGDRVKINEGTFDSFEGEVESIDEANGRVTVIINIFGRSTPVELEYWQVEAL